MFMGFCSCTGPMEREELLTVLLGVMVCVCWPLLREAVHEEYKHSADVQSLLLLLRLVKMMNTRW